MCVFLSTLCLQMRCRPRRKQQLDSLQAQRHGSVVLQRRASVIMCWLRGSCPQQKERWGDEEGKCTDFNTGKVFRHLCLAKKMNNLSHSIMLGCMVNPYNRYKKGGGGGCGQCLNAAFLRFFSLLILWNILDVASFSKQLFRSCRFKLK